MPREKENEKTDTVVCRCCNGKVCVAFSAQAGKQSSRKVNQEADTENSVDVASLGPTTFWLSCQNISSLVGKLEFYGAVSFFERRLKADETLMAMYLDSHDSYVHQLKKWMPLVVHNAFVTKFVEVKPLTASDAALAPSGGVLQLAQRKRRPTTGDATEAPEVTGEGEKKEKKSDFSGLHSTRRYGNASVSSPSDVKCLHAQLGGALGGVPTPIGCAVANYVLHLESELAAVTGVEGKTTDEHVGEKRKPPESDENIEKSSLLAAIKNLSHLGAFLDQQKTEAYLPHPEKWFSTAPPSAGGNSEEANSDSVPTSGLCDSALKVLMAIDGHAPRTRKKKRLN